ncbi:DoxX family protein [Qipengyuania marisflavi]|uniref:DoxX family protein n=1 Tax=Qipengyuania marisflavi TaxID=2486356 RepID=A0A5S3PXX4_9SPHN|nr:DoxX family protein [Qipengyuania marisflavi]TMM48445.1 DoxX family protein [Qipengyuania marisflavi]
MATIAAIIGRILIGVLFIIAGLGKVMDPAGTAQYMEASSPFPGSLALGVGIFEIAAGLVLASGFMTRIASLALIGFTALATLFFHSKVTDPAVAAMALKNLAVIGGLLMVFAYGQMRGRMDVIEERAKRLDAEVRAAHAEGKAEGATTVAAQPVTPVVAEPVAAEPVAPRPVAVKPVVDRDGDGRPD